MTGFQLFTFSSEFNCKAWSFPVSSTYIWGLCQLQKLRQKSNNLNQITCNELDHASFSELTRHNKKTINEPKRQLLENKEKIQR